MSMKTLTLPSALLVLALAACSKTPSEPKGQVVASVGSHEITVADIAAETGDLNPSLTPAARKSVEQAALQQIIARYIVADAARAAKLENTPLAAILEKRGQESALVDMFQRKLQREVPSPSAEEAKLYASDHPASFTQRRIFLVDQYVARNVPPSVLKALEPLDTLEQVGTVLTQNKISFSRTVGVIDALSVDPDAAEKIAGLPPQAVFVSPEGDVVRVNRVRETQIDPVLGNDAIRIAQEIIKNRRSAELLERQMTNVLQAGERDVRFNPAYRLPNVSGGPPSPGASATTPPMAK